MNNVLSLHPLSQKQNPVVEMPGDSLERLDVQFGDLDLDLILQTSATNDSHYCGPEKGVRVECFASLLS